MTFAGVIAGTALASWVSGQVLIAVFASIALLVALKMAPGLETFAIGDGLPGPVRDWNAGQPDRGLGT